MFSGVNSTTAIPSSSTLWLREQSRAPSLGLGYVVPTPSNGTMNPSDSRYSPWRFRFPLYTSVDAPPATLHRVSSTGLIIFRHMPPLLPRKTSEAASVLQATEHRPSPYVHWVGVFMIINEATPGFTFVAACGFANWELTTPDYSDAAPLSYQGARTSPWAGLQPAR